MAQKQQQQLPSANVQIVPRKLRRNSRMAEKSTTRSTRQSNPEALPSTTPFSYPGSEHSWTLQTVFELQKTVGQLTQAVTTLTEQQKGFSIKLDRISHQMYAALAILLLLGGILGFFSKSINDIIVHSLEPAKTQQSSPQH
jgi:hypothetical protein